MKDTNKLMASLLVGAVASLTPAASHAAFTTLGIFSSTASVTVTGGSASLAISIHNVADNAVASAITWPAVAAGAGYTMASQYVELDTTLSVAGAGVQTYTDNTAADANPRFTGPINSTQQTPAGLVSTTDTTQKLPTAWEITDTTATVTPAEDPNAKTPNSFAWFFHEDKAQVAVPTQNAAAFVNGVPYVTAMASGNTIHFAQDPTSFGAAPSPNYVYLEASFASAIGGTTYKTSTLRFELFTQ